MSDSPNATLVRRLYDSGMAPEVTAEIISPDLVWDITPGFPHSGIYHGWESVGRDFFGKLLPEYESFPARRSSSSPPPTTTSLSSATTTSSARPGPRPTPASSTCGRSATAAHPPAAGRRQPRGARSPEQLTPPRITQV